MQAESQSELLEETADAQQRPKYRIILETLRQGIAEGDYPPSSRMPSETDLVRRFGASRMTVVKAMKALEQMGMVTRRVGSGTYVRAQPAPEGLQFGLLIPELGQTEIFEPICRGMAGYQAPDRHSLLWGNSMLHGVPKEEAAEQLCRHYIDRRVAGVFFAPLELAPTKDEVNRQVVRALDRAGIPVVLLDRDLEPYPARSRYDMVGIDNRRTAYAATMHLVAAGAQRVAFIGLPLSAATVDARVSGYREALRAAGLPPQPDRVTRGDPADSRLIATVLNEQKPDAFLCANDHTAATLMQTLIELGMRVPEEIRIAGIDDVKYASLLPIPLTTQHQPCLDLGTMAMFTMLSRLEKPDFPHRDILLDCRLVVRRSCGST